MRAFSIAMIVLGSFLEVYFYVYRFIQDGTPLYISITIASALNLLLALAVLRAKNSKGWLFISIPIIVYSVFSTSAGQTFSLLSRESSVISKVSIDGNDKTIERYEKDIASLSREREAILDRLSKIDTVEKRFEYKQTISNDEKRIKEIDTEKTRIQDLINATTKEIVLSTEQSIHSTSIYDFYSGINIWRQTEWLKFIFHSILSIFIALMTPVGLLSWPKINTQPSMEKDSHVTPVQTQTMDDLIKPEPMPPGYSIPISREEVERFVNLSWYRVRQNTSEFLLPESTFFDFMKRQSFPFSIDTYHRLIELCIELKLSDKQGKVIIREESRAISILMEASNVE